MEKGQEQMGVKGREERGGEERRREGRRDERGDAEHETQGASRCPKDMYPRVFGNSRMFEGQVTPCPELYRDRDSNSLIIQGQGFRI